MRQLLFRGQTRRKGEKVRLDGTPVESNWVYGGVMQGEGDYSIIYQAEPEFHKYPVYSDTLGQYTGLTDKNGNKIFENDILRVNYHGVEIGRVCIYYEFAMYLCNVIYGDIDFDTLGMLNANYQLEVIGNVYDNPELANAKE